jgi:DtxR family manganese transport transcriptional regulator
VTPASEPHRRTRRDHAAETAEDYVEAIDDFQRVQGSCRVSDLARQFDVSHVTVSKVVSRLKREGLVSSARYRPLELTKAGCVLAAQARDRHRIVVSFLEAIGVPAELAAVDAEGIEHHASPETLACFQQLTQRLQRSTGAGTTRRGARPSA